MSPAIRNENPINGMPSVIPAPSRAAIAASTQWLRATSIVAHHVVIHGRFTLPIPSFLTTISLSNMTTFPSPQLRLLENTFKCRHFPQRSTSAAPTVHRLPLRGNAAPTTPSLGLVVGAHRV